LKLPSAYQARAFRNIAHRSPDSFIRQADGNWPDVLEGPAALATGPGRRFAKGKRYTLMGPDGHLLMNPPAEPQLVWLGHASFLFQYRGLSVLTDPVLPDRASPFRLVGPRRSGFTRILAHAGR